MNVHTYDPKEPHKYKLPLYTISVIIGFVLGFALYNYVSIRVMNHHHQRPLNVIFTSS